MAALQRATLLLLGLPPKLVRGDGGSTTPSASRPTLLGLRPDAGPRDGSTRVRLDLLGVDAAAEVTAVLRGVRRAQGGRQQQQQALHVKVQRSEDELFFMTPNLASLSPAGAGILVSLEVHTGTPHDRRMLTGPLFFRVLEPLAKLAPAWIDPCCSFTLTGGQPVLLSGAVAAVPALRPVVRLKGAEHSREVDGQLVQDEWGLAAVAQDLPAHAWHVYAVMPPWPHVENDVVLEISWNGQQFASGRKKVHFAFQKSLFGGAAEHISEKHLPQEPDAGAAGDEPGETHVALVEQGTESGFRLPGQTLDFSNALLLDKQGDAFILARSKDLTHLSEDLRIVHDLFRLTCVATILGAAALCFRAPSIIGYLLGGVLLGPGCLDVLVELVQIESVAELGICLLLFCIGLELTWVELRANLRASLAGLLAMVLLCGLIVMFAAFCTRTPLYEALCVGLFSSLASTAVSLKAIPTANGEASPAETNGEASALLAILVTQDIILAGLLAVMPLVFRHSQVPASSHDPSNLLTAVPAGEPPPQPAMGWRRPTLVLAAVLFLAGAAVRFRHKVGQLVALLRMWLKAQLLKMDEEFFTLLVLSYAFACAYTTDGLGLSVELGAFVAGLTLNSCSAEVAKRTEHRVQGLKDTFVAWFFAAIGLIVNPRFLFDNLRPIVSVVALLFLLKLFTGFLPLWLLSKRGTPRPALRALRTAWVLTNVSEFGFVLASKGVGWGVISRHVYLLLVGANAVSLCLAPWLFRSREWLLPEDAPQAGTEEEEVEGSGGGRLGFCRRVLRKRPRTDSTTPADAWPEQLRSPSGSSSREGKSFTNGEICQQVQTEPVGPECLGRSHGDDCDDSIA